ncbi:MAG TPA: ABC transporter ATP-binding protein [Euryarchaeota archaeon]|nr:daunorubicin/doxorubicin resistance ATP-binding protein DrrA [archaeon BMS3Bbin15]HDL15485.1 ABC transporter ATP-binding protein [Euryarchaeota archaeon]
MELDIEEQNLKWMIETTDLTKRFGNFTAVKNLNLRVKRGEIYGFLGPNGAGKTTTIKMLNCLLNPSSGSARIAGFDIRKDALNVKAITGYLPETPLLYDKLTGKEFLDFIAELYGVDDARKERKINDLLRMFTLTEKADSLIQGYSHGMRQKIGIAAALIHDPKVLFLDEPTMGLDPKSARMVKDILKELVKRGSTVFMSTHVLEIAEKMCDEVGIVNHGTLIASGSIETLRKSEQGNSLEDIFLELTGGPEYQDVMRYLED